nr:protein IQ-DOMAIN 14-like [Aegilops tauschii subsp. strangulata]
MNRKKRYKNKKRGEKENPLPPRGFDPAGPIGHPTRPAQHPHYTYPHFPETLTTPLSPTPPSPRPVSGSGERPPFPLSPPRDLDRERPSAHRLDPAAARRPRRQPSLPEVSADAAIAPRASASSSSRAEAAVLAPRHRPRCLAALVAGDPDAAPSSSSSPSPLPRPYEPPVRPPSFFSPLVASPCARRARTPSPCSPGPVLALTATSPRPACLCTHTRPRPYLARTLRAAPRRPDPAVPARAGLGLLRPSTDRAQPLPPPGHHRLHPATPGRTREGRRRPGPPLLSASCRCRARPPAQLGLVPSLLWPRARAPIARNHSAPTPESPVARALYGL